MSKNEKEREEKDVNSSTNFSLVEISMLYLMHHTMYDIFRCNTIFECTDTREDEYC